MPRRRDVLKYAAAGLTLLVTRVGAGATAMASVLAVRVWPARDYTRVTLENDQAIRYTQMLVKDPERLVVDLEGVEFNQVLQTLPTKIIEADPYIKLIRAGRNKPGVVRLVIELKGEVKPQVFALKPVGEYGHRLVLDLYPVEPVDPLMALLEKSQTADPKGLKAESKRGGEVRAGDKPTPVETEKADAKPFYASPWFWGAVGAAAALGTTAIVIASAKTTDTLSLRGEVLR